MEEPPVSADPCLRPGAVVDEARPPEVELLPGVVDGFTACFVGDCVISRPLSALAERDAGFRDVLDVLASADVVHGNLETTVFDVRGFAGHPYAWDGDWALAASPDVAADLTAMNIRLMSRANNHALDWGLAGMRSTDRALDAAGIVHAGTGEHASAARAARYLETARGRVALTSFATTFAPFSDALDPRGEAPGRPGVSGLRLSRSLVLPAAVADGVRDVARVMAGTDDPSGLRALFGLGIEVDETGEGGRNRYRADAEQLVEILRAVRLGKQHSDLVVTALHAHEADNESVHSPAADVVGVLGRSAIDHGADAFVTTGIHHLGAVGVHRGKPVLTGLGNFIWSDIQEPVPADLYARNRGLLDESFDHPGLATDADLSGLLNARDYAHPEVFESVVARCRYEGGELAALELFPVELGRGSTLTASGVPRLAGSVHGAEIIGRLAALSESWGTRIDYVDTVGRVRL